MKRHTGTTIAVLAVLALALAALPLLLTEGSVAQAVKPADKIELDLLDRLALEGQADFIVRFADQADLAPAYRMNWYDRGEFVWSALQETAGRSQGRAKRYLDGRGLRYETFFAGNDLYVWAGDLTAVNALAELPEVSSIRLARTYYLDPIVDTGASIKAAPHALAWGITDTKANQFWTTFGKQGDGIVVANIDTGVQWNHPALDQAYKCAGDPGNAACWADPSNVCGGTPCDNNGHGSHTMGTMVADDDPGLTWQAGMAPNATWIACKGCESSSCSDYALNACADWIVAPNGNPNNRPHVVNNSWGGGGGDTWYQAKVNAWRAAGIFPAFSAGNSGSSCSTLGSPGDYQESFATAAHDSGRTIASFSSRGPSAFGHEPYTKPNISAPGVDICSTVPGNNWSCSYSGTSMASPHTAGAVALLWSCAPSLIGNIDGTFQALQNTANAAPAGNCGAPPDGQGNYTYGYGYLDVLAAGTGRCGAPATPVPTSTPTPTFTPYPTVPPVTPIDWVNLPVVGKNSPLGPTAVPTPVPTVTPVPTLPPPVGFSEGFEGGVVPPAGWTRLQTNPRETWKIAEIGSPHGGAYYADCEYDAELAQQDELLLSPAVQISAGTLTFWSFGSLYWCRDTYNNCNLDIWVVVGDWGGGNDTYIGSADTSWSGSWVWSQSTFNLTPYLPGGPVRIGFRYVGLDGAQIGLDDILLNGTPLALAPAR